MFITALLRKEWRGEWRAAAVSDQLGYTAMTLSRAVRELTAAGLLVTHRRGRSRRLEVAHEPAVAWEHARPLLRSPVRRRVWVEHDAFGKRRRPVLAGLSALASYSMLTEPPNPVYAVGPAEWKAIQQRGVRTLPQGHAYVPQLEVWTYLPTLVVRSEAVDPLSLTLS